MGSRKQFAAYVGSGMNAGTEVLFENSSDKYDYAGLVMRYDGTWGAVKFGWSFESVQNRTLTYVGKSRPNLDPAYRTTVMDVTRTWEVTAPIVREYFGSHRVVIAKAFHPERGWEDLRTRAGVGRKAGSARIRSLAKEGYTAIAFAQGKREADFQMTELLASMNKRTWG